MNNPASQRTASFDWQQVKERLARLQDSLGDGEHLKADQIKRLMEERARQLAKVPERQPDTSELVEVVRFRIGNEEAAIETRFVLALTQLQYVTPIPDVEPYFVGVTNLRGEITTVIDLARFLEIPSERDGSERDGSERDGSDRDGRDRDDSDRVGRDRNGESQALVLGTETPDCAVLVDGLHQVTTIERDEILEPAGGSGIIVDLMIGNTRDAIMILDGEALLRCEKLVIDQNE